jgi:hypothetical protein
MTSTLQSLFEKVKGYIEGEPPANFLQRDEFPEIKEKMNERGLKLELHYECAWPPTKIKNLGIVHDDKTSVYEIMHAEGNLESVFEEVTHRPLDRKDIQHYKPEDLAPEAAFYLGMF